MIVLVLSGSLVGNMILVIVGSRFREQAHVTVGSLHLGSLIGCPLIVVLVAVLVGALAGALAGAQLESDLVAALANNLGAGNFGVAAVTGCN